MFAAGLGKLGELQVGQKREKGGAEWHQCFGSARTVGEIPSVIFPLEIVETGEEGDNRSVNTGV